MKSTLAQFSSKNPRSTGRRFAYTFTLSLILVVSTAVPVFADAVRINQVVQTVSPRGTTSLKLDTLVPQDPASGTNGSTQQNGPRSESSASQGQAGTDSLLSGISVASDGLKIGVDIIEEGEVEGTVCDCGEILIAGGGFPKWPLVFLSAVPFIFIRNCETCGETPFPTPTPPSIPTPTPTPTPEPASLLLFGTGLLAAGAGLRRRYSKAKVVKPQEDE